MDTAEIIRSLVAGTGWPAGANAYSIPEGRYCRCGHRVDDHADRTGSCACGCDRFAFAVSRDARGLHVER